jgi:hypothetical protein
MDLGHEETILSWNNPSPVEGEAVTLDVSVRNQAGKGDVSFVLQRAVEGGFWAEVARIDVVASAGGMTEAQLPTVADVSEGETVEYRMLVLVDEVEMDRRTVDPLIVKGETVRDGDALVQQAAESTFAIALYLIALISLSLAMWMLVMNRRIRSQEIEGGAVDATDDVIEAMGAPKSLPDIEAAPPAPTEPHSQPAAVAPAVAPSGQPAPPPLPPTGLPDGWTQDQWNHFGWQFVESMLK